MANVTTKIVEEMLKQGKSASDIGKEYNISRQAVYHHINKLKKKEKHETVFPKPKKSYNSLIDWRIYNEGLVKRGEVLLDFEFFSGWDEELDVMNEGKVGYPYEYPDSFIQFLMRLKCVFKIDYRTLEGITRKLIIFVPKSQRAPDYSTLQFRFSNMEYKLEVYQEHGEQVVAGDSTGLKTSNRGEYRMNKYRGKRKEFVKLHIIVNIKTRQIISWSVTKEEVRDGKEMPKLISGAKKYGKIKEALFDRAYDDKNNYWMLQNEEIKPGIKPRKTMKLERVNQEIEKEEKRLIFIKGKNKREKIQARLLRLKTLKEYLQDKEKWKEENGYGERWKAEGRYSVFKRVFGEHVFSKKMGNISKEVAVKLSLMNIFAYLTIEAIKTGCTIA